MAHDQFSKGDKVEWKSHGQSVKGTVEEKITEDQKSAGRTVRASEDNPQYRVTSDKPALTPCTNQKRYDTPPDETDDDYATMRKVVAYAKSHLAQQYSG